MLYTLAYHQSEHKIKIGMTFILSLRGVGIHFICKSTKTHHKFPVNSRQHTPTLGRNNDHGEGLQPGKTERD